MKLSKSCAALMLLIPILALSAFSSQVSNLLLVIYIAYTCISSCDIIRLTEKKAALFFFLLLIFGVPLAIGLVAGPLSFDRLAEGSKLLAKQVPFIFSILLLAPTKNHYPSGKKIEQLVNFVRLLSFLSAGNILFYHLTGGFQFLPFAITTNLASAEINRLYPLGFGAILGSLPWALLTRNLPWISCIILVAISTGGRGAVMQIVFGFLAFFWNDFLNALRLRLKTSFLQSFILALLVLLAVAPWNRLNLGEIISDTAPRSALSFLAIQNTLQSPLSMAFGRSPFEPSSIGYLALNPSSDPNLPVVINSQYNVETFYGQFFSRHGFIGLASIITIALIIANRYYSSYFVLFVLVNGISNGIINDPNSGVCLCLCILFVRVNLRVRGHVWRVAE